MSKAYKLTQLEFKMPDKVGLLAEITTALAERGINLKAICAYGVEGQAEFLLVTDDNEKAQEVLKKLGVQVNEEEVTAVEMPDEPGALQKVAKKIAEAGINISYMYGTAGAGESAVCIFKTPDEERTVKAISE
jgi:hypothetical protein